MIEIAAELAIRDLITRYCYCLDQGRFTDLAALFAEDGTWEAQYGVATGPAQIARFLEELVPPAPKRRHFVTNVLVERTDDGVVATSYYLVVRDSETGPMVSVAGTYHDRMVEVAQGEWRFHYRRLEPAILGDLGLSR